MAVKRYDGSAWQTVAGLGAQGPAATSSSIATWVKTASGGETSLSGNDDNSQSLSYTVGQELVFINGTLLKRGSDYTATNGTSITGLTALAANDVATVWTVNAFSVTGAIANTIVDAKADLIVGTAADTPGRLAVGTNGQILTADSTTGTGLKWAAPSGGALTWSLLNSGGTTLSGSAKTTISFSAQKQLFILYKEVSSGNASSFFQIRLNDDSGANYEAAGNYGRIYDPLQSDNTSQPWYVAGFTEIRGARMSTAASSQMWGSVAVYNADSTSYKIYTALGGGNRDGGNNAEVINQQGFYSGTSAVTSISFNSSTGNFDAGTVYVYGGV